MALEAHESIPDLIYAGDGAYFLLEALAEDLDRWAEDMDERQVVRREPHQMLLAMNVEGSSEAEWHAIRERTLTLVRRLATLPGDPTIVGAWADLVLALSARQRGGPQLFELPVLGGRRGDALPSELFEESRTLQARLESAGFHLPARIIRGIHRNLDQAAGITLAAAAGPEEDMRVGSSEALTAMRSMRRGTAHPKTIKIWKQIADEFESWRAIYWK